MAITEPTIDDFDDTTVVLTIKKVVEYIMETLVPGINDNDVVSGAFSLSGNNLSCALTKGDGTTITIPAITLPGGGTASPYPTGVTITLSGTTLNFNMTMSSGDPITATCDLSGLGGGASIDSVEVTVNRGIRVSVNGVQSNFVSLQDYIIPTSRYFIGTSLSEIVTTLEDLVNGARAVGGIITTTENKSLSFICTGYKKNTNVIDGVGLLFENNGNGNVTVSPLTGVNINNSDIQFNSVGDITGFGKTIILSQDISTIRMFSLGES